MQLAIAVLFGLVLPLLDQVTLSLLLGGATFGLIYYFRAYKDGHLTQEESGYLDIVTKLVKITIVVQAIIQGLSVAVGLYAYKTEPSLYQRLSFSDFYTPILLLSIIVVAMLIRMHEISKAMAPAIAGALWYAYFIIRQIPEAGLLSPIQFFAIVILWLCLFVLGFDTIKKLYWKRKSK